MSRPDPIQYAERLYGAIRAANFSPISFLAFGNAVKDGVSLRNMTRIAVEPFMRVVGEMLDLEEEAAAEEIIDAQMATEAVSTVAEMASPPPAQESVSAADSIPSDTAQASVVSDAPSTSTVVAEKRRGKR